MPNIHEGEQIRMGPNSDISSESSIQVLSALTLTDGAMTQQD